MKCFSEGGGYVTGFDVDFTEVGGVGFGEGRVVGGFFGREEGRLGTDVGT